LSKKKGVWEEDIAPGNKKISLKGRTGVVGE
jgi:hypothetical protein